MLINSFISNPYYKHVTLFDWSTGGLSFCYEKRIRLGKTIKFNITVSNNVSFYMKAKVVHNSSMKVIKDQTFFRLAERKDSYIIGKVALYIFVFMMYRGFTLLI